MVLDKEKDTAVACSKIQWFCLVGLPMEINLMIYLGIVFPVKNGPVTQHKEYNHVHELTRQS